jgi:signal transduction histidine kinase
LGVFIATLLFSPSAFPAPAEVRVPAADGLAVLTNIAEIRALTAAEADRHHPVQLRAVVTFHNLGRLCFVQDPTGAIFVQRKGDAAVVRPGQLVELEGVTQSGDWAPIVRESRLQVLQTVALPPARPVSYDELASGETDSRRVEVNGIVRFSERVYDHLHLEIAVGGGRLRAYVYDYPQTNYLRLVDSNIRLRGVAGSIFNHKKQLAAPLLFADGPDCLTVDKLSPANPFAAHSLPASSLLQYLPGMDYGHRVKIKGVVTYQEPGYALFIRDGVQGVRIATQTTIAVKPGDIVEAVGFPVMGQYTPALEDAAFRVIGSGPAPAPVATTLDQALSGAKDANLITLEARMINLVQHGHERVLVLQAGNVIFNAHLPQIENAPDGAELGSWLRLTGICSIQEVKESLSFLNPQSFELLLRSPRDIVVLQRPPWWTLSRLLWILSAMAVVILIGVAWVVVLNRRVREQTEIIHQRVQREAMLEERSRIAREFHDTLEQELAGIALQLDTVAIHLKTSPALAMKQLEMARNLGRHTLAEARRSVWDLRSHLLENNNLPAALAEVTRSLGQAGGQIQVQTSGTPRKLPARVENNLLRIVQEALGNALKYAQAKTILVKLDYLPDKIRLAIQDDGIGFDISQAPGTSTGHFGLLGMRERAERVSASFSLRSSPGAGTEVMVEVAEGALKMKPQRESGPPDETRLET